MSKESDLEFVAGGFSLTLPSNVSGGHVNKAANEHALRGTLARSICHHLVVQFVGTYHVAGLPVHTVK